MAILALSPPERGGAQIEVNVRATLGKVHGCKERSGTPLSAPGSLIYGIRL
jgi:hypothetical protein